MSLNDNNNMYLDALLTVYIYIIYYDWLSTLTNEQCR